MKKSMPKKASKKQKDKNTIAVLVVIGIVLLGILGVVFLPRKPQPQVSQQVEIPKAISQQVCGSIQGYAYVAKGSGSEVLRDIEVALLKPGCIKKENSILEDWQTAKTWAQDGISSFELLADRINNYAAPAVLQTVRTDVNGKFAFDNVPAGEYVLFAQYCNKASYVAWFEPITLTGKLAEGKLTNSNSQKIITLNLSEPCTIEEHLEYSKRRVSASREVKEWAEANLERAQANLARARARN